MPLTKVTTSFINSISASQILPSNASSGDTLIFDGATQTWKPGASTSSSSITYGVPVAMTGLSNTEFVGIPSTAKRVTVIIRGLSSANMPKLLLGTSSGIKTTGYFGTVYGYSGAGISTASISNGILLRDSGWTTSITAYGMYTFVKLSDNDNSWTFSGQFGGNHANSSAGGRTDGSTSLDGPLSRIRLETSGTFGGGTVNIMWE